MESTESKIFGPGRWDQKKMSATLPHPRVSNPITKKVYRLSWLCALTTTPEFAMHHIATGGQTHLWHVHGKTARSKLFSLVTQDIPRSMACSSMVKI